MSNWQDATRKKLDALIVVCPKCGSTNIPGASPTIEVVKDQANCATCGHGWRLKPAA